MTKAHVSFFILIINPAPACAHRVETPGVRLSRCAAERKLNPPSPPTLRLPNSLSAPRNVHKRSSSTEPDRLRAQNTQPFFSGARQTCIPGVFGAGGVWVPVHFRLVSSLLEELSSLQSKFSSQNSANHTFLRLFSSVSPVKYSSNPGNGGEGRRGGEKKRMRREA